MKQPPFKYERTPTFLREYAAIMRNEAESRPQHPEFQETLRGWAERAEREADAREWPDVQLDLFSTPPRP